MRIAAKFTILVVRAGLLFAVGESALAQYHVTITNQMPYTISYALNGGIFSINTNQSMVHHNQNPQFKVTFRQRAATDTTVRESNWDLLPNSTNNFQQKGDGFELYRDPGTGIVVPQPPPTPAPIPGPTPVPAKVPTPPPPIQFPYKVSTGYEDLLIPGRIGCEMQTDLTINSNGMIKGDTQLWVDSGPFGFTGKVYLLVLGDNDTILSSYESREWGVDPSWALYSSKRSPRDVVWYHQLNQDQLSRMRRLVVVFEHAPTYRALKVYVDYVRGGRKPEDILRDVAGAVINVR